MNEHFTLHIAHPDNVTYCVQEKLSSIVGTKPALIIYGCFNGCYVEELNDDPDRVDEWTTAEEIWCEKVCGIYKKLIERSPGTPMMISRRFFGWKAAPLPKMTVEMPRALGSFATDPLIWTMLAKPCRFAHERDLVIALRKSPWWLMHGYKEPFLVIGTSDPTNEVARLLDATVCSELFYSNRTRLNKNYHS